MNKPAVSYQQEQLRETTVRAMCRKQYRDEDDLTNPFQVGTFERSIWNLEATAIEYEETESSNH